MKFPKEFNLTLLWRKYTRKFPLITDKDFEDIEKEIDKDLHIHEPAGKVYKYKNNKYNH